MRVDAYIGYKKTEKDGMDGFSPVQKCRNVTKYVESDRVNIHFPKVSTFFPLLILELSPEITKINNKTTFVCFSEQSETLFCAHQIDRDTNEIQKMKFRSDGRRDSTRLPCLYLEKDKKKRKEEDVNIWEEETKKSCLVCTDEAA